MAAPIADLRRVPLFGGLSERQLKKLARDFRPRAFRAGAAVVRQGEMSGVGFFIVTAGEARVSVNGAEVATLGPGDHFGELGLVSERERSATVTAGDGLECVEIPVWHFRRFVKDNPDVAWKLLQHLASLVADAEERLRQPSAAAAG
ncbi:MAG TPA: cyclic nucleotide-binding domain-containing protein [Gaiellaceae bacterium]|nr:cyclic nucleotide-binding domain-containing protein [Gaiellaceae bacterium]